MLCVVIVAGCGPNKRGHWVPHFIAIDDINSLTLLYGSIVLDGGTVTLLAVTDGGYLCTIDLNQHTIPSDGSRNPEPFPGRLLFNNSPIDVRSRDEQLLIGLLQKAEVLYVDVEGLRELSQAETVNLDQLEAIKADDDNDHLDRLRNQIVTFVLSDAYVNIAKRVQSTR